MMKIAVPSVLGLFISNRTVFEYYQTRLAKKTMTIIYNWSVDP